MSTTNSTLKLWAYLKNSALGRWVFSRLLCLKAPYFGSIKPLFLRLEPGFCSIRIEKRRRVHNHLGTVHAIAMCNMAELAGGVMTEVTVPSGLRWIPVGMQVRYLKMAKSALVAEARLMEGTDLSQAGDQQVKVEVKDAWGEMVFDAIISMRISAKKR